MFLCSPKAALVFLYLKFKSDGHLHNRVPILFNGTRNPRLVLRALVFVNVGWQVGHISKVIFQIIHGVVSLLLQGSVYAMNKASSAYRSYPRPSLPFEPMPIGKSLRLLDLSGEFKSFLGCDDRNGLIDNGRRRDGTLYDLNQLRRGSKR